MERIDSASIHQRKVQSLNDSNGFVNFFNISGTLKSIDRANNRIELLINRKNPNYSIAIDIDSANVSTRYRVGAEVTCTGFVRGVNTDGAWGLRFRGKHLSNVNASEMDIDALRDWFRRMGDPYEPSVNLLERVSTTEHHHARSKRRAGNYIGLSGFVHAIKFYPGKQINERGDTKGDSVKMLIRQFEDEKLNILVELNGTQARSTYNLVMELSGLGRPQIRFHGEAYVKIKDTQQEVPVLDDQGNPKVDESGTPVVELQTTTVIFPCIKAIAKIDVAGSEHLRQPKTVVDPETGKERIEYPYPWAKVYEERALAAKAKQRRLVRNQEAATV